MVFYWRLGEQRATLQKYNVAGEDGQRNAVSYVNPANAAARANELSYSDHAVPPQCVASDAARYNSCFVFHRTRRIHVRHGV